MPHQCKCEYCHCDEPERVNGYCRTCWRFKADYINDQKEQDRHVRAMYMGSGPLDQDYISDHMDFPPHFENGPAPLGSDY